MVWDRRLRGRSAVDYREVEEDEGWTSDDEMEQLGGNSSAAADGASHNNTAAKLQQNSQKRDLPRVVQATTGLWSTTTGLDRLTADDGPASEHTVSQKIQPSTNTTFHDRPQDTVVQLSGAVEGHSTRRTSNRLHEPVQTGRGNACTGDIVNRLILPFKEDRSAAKRRHRITKKVEVAPWKLARHEIPSGDVNPAVNTPSTTMPGSEDDARNAPSDADISRQLERTSNTGSKTPGGCATLELEFRASLAEDENSKGRTMSAKVAGPAADHVREGDVLPSFGNNPPVGIVGVIIGTQADAVMVDSDRNSRAGPYSRSEHCMVNTENDAQFAVSSEKSSAEAARTPSATLHSGFLEAQSCDGSQADVLIVADDRTRVNLGESINVMEAMPASAILAPVTGDTTETESRETHLDTAVDTNRRSADKRDDAIFESTVSKPNSAARNVATNGHAAAHGHGSAESASGGSNASNVNEGLAASAGESRQTSGGAVSDATAGPVPGTVNTTVKRECTGASVSVRKRRDVGKDAALTHSGDKDDPPTSDAPQSSMKRCSSPTLSAAAMKGGVHPRKKRLLLGSAFSKGRLVQATPEAMTPAESPESSRAVLAESEGGAAGNFPPVSRDVEGSHVPNRSEIGKKDVVRPGEQSAASTINVLKKIVAFGDHAIRTGGQGVKDCVPVPVPNRASAGRRSSSDCDRKPVGPQASTVGSAASSSRTADGEEDSNENSKMQTVENRVRESLARCKAELFVSMDIAEEAMKGRKAIWTTYQKLFNDFTNVSAECARLKIELANEQEARTRQTVIILSSTKVCHGLRKALSDARKSAARDRARLVTTTGGIQALRASNQAYARDHAALKASLANEISMHGSCRQKLQRLTESLSSSRGVLDICS